MYSHEDRVRAVELFIKYDHSFAQVKRELGYPNSSTSLELWFEEYKRSKTLHESYTRGQKYTAEQKQEAIEYYYAHGRCIRRTVRMLGYPSSTLLKEWLEESHPEDFQHCPKRTSMVNLNLEQKEQAVLDLCSRTEPAKNVAAEYGVSRCSLYIWKKQLLPERSPSRMPKAEKHNNLTESEQVEKLSQEVAALSAEAEELKKQVYRLQLEKDALQMAAEIIKKRPGHQS